MSPSPTTPAPVPSAGAAGAGASATLTLSIVSHGQAALVSHLLDDLRRITPPGIARILITLNLPEPRPDVAGLPWPVEFIENPQPLGFAANHNQAFGRVGTAHFAILNPDLRLHDDPFASLLKSLADPAVGIASPVVLEPDGRVADFARPLATPGEILARRLGLRDRNAHRHGFDWVAGMFLVMRSETYRALGGFDERYRLYCEDIDLSARVRLAGLRIEIAQDARVTHAAQRASGKSLRHLRWHVASLLRWWTSPTYRHFRRILTS